MELLFEIIFELVFEGSIEIATSRKISKWIRYPLIFLIISFIIAALSMIGLIGVILLIRNEKPLDLWGGMLLIVFDIILIISAIINVKKELQSRDNE